MLFRLIIAFALALCADSGYAELVILYDGNGLPASQSWLIFGSDALSSGGVATQSAVGGGVSLVTDNPVSAGYSNFGAPNNALFPTLDRSQGFQLNFTLQLNSEAHTSTDRAGFSVILLGSDRQGIELGFWQDEIWAQTSLPRFTHGAGVTWDTTVRTDYGLAIHDNTYTLSQGGAAILNGAVQDYSASGILPYVLSNFLFLGDNTSSAGADVVLGPITLQSNLSAIPEPSSLALLGLAVSGLLQRHRRK